MRIPVSPRRLPVVRHVDLVIAGGTIAGVAAALKTVELGAKVLIAAPRMHLGEDVCSTLQLVRGDEPGAEEFLLGEIFYGRTTTPLQVKHALTRQLVEAGVEVLLGCMPVGLVKEAANRACGLVIANRQGRQVVQAKGVIDATQFQLLSERRIDAGPIKARRIVLAGDDSEIAPMQSFDAGVMVDNEDLSFHQYGFEFDLVEDTPAAWAELGQQARDLSYRPGQKRAAESLIWDVQHHETCIPSLPWGSSEVDGRALAASLWKDIAKLTAEGLHLEVIPAENGDAAQVSLAEHLNGLRPSDDPEKTIAAPADSLQVLAQVDVVVVGGGTSGAAAAIAAAREGTRVLVLEYQECLGGVGTIGLITKPYAGLSIGFAGEVPFLSDAHGVEYKMEWLRRELRQAGGQMWLQTLCFGTLKRDRAVCGVAVATPYGHGAVLAKVVIDATGNADVAAAAGAQTMFGADKMDIASQGVGLATRPLGKDYVNSDFLLVDDSDIVDVSLAVLGSTLALEPDQCYDTIPFIQSRERRRIVGDTVISYLDQLLGRTYPDTIVVSSSDYDSHGYPSLPYFALLPHNEETIKLNHPAPSGKPYTPYRALLPKGLEGMLVIGLGTSMHRDASAMVRMQKDLLNQGYAAGLAAVQAIDAGVQPRQIDISQLQQRLIVMGALEESVLTDQDSFPLPEEMMAQAVQDFVNPELGFDERSHALAIIFSFPETAKPMLKRHYAATPTLDYAKVLGFLGEADGADLVLEALHHADFDAKIFQGHMAEYAHLPTPMDALVLASAYCGDSRALPLLLEKLRLLTTETTLSHHRSLALALEHLQDSRAAEVLAALLSKPGMSGHVMAGVEPLFDRPFDKRRREGALREITLARALYRCGDFEGMGQRILTAYTQDLRGHFAQHAKAVLSS